MSNIRRNYFRLGDGGQMQFRLSSDIDILRFGLSRPLTLLVHTEKMIAPNNCDVDVNIL